MTITDRPVLRFGAIAGGVGVGLQLVMEHLHPHHEQPNNTVAAFSEYSHATGWTAVHVGQFFGALVVVFLSNELSAVTPRWQMVLGVVYFVVVMYAPGGLAVLGPQVWSRLRGRRARPAATDP